MVIKGGQNMKESKYSQKVTDYLNKLGAVVDNNTASIYARVGRSDLTVLYKGVYIALELKTGSYQPTDLQIIYLQKIRENGGIGLIIRDNLEELEKLIYYIDINKLEMYKQPKLPKLKTPNEIIYD